MQRINAGAIGLVVVVLALLVTAPRLAHAFIMADGLAMDATWEYWLLVLTGIASGLVLTLGNAYLAHVLASHFKRGDALSWILLGAWCVYLVFAVALIAPALVVGLTRSPLTAVLWWPLVWVYAVVAALSVEVLVAGSMAGYAIARKNAQEDVHDRNAATSPSGAVAGDTDMAWPASGADASACATDAQATRHLAVGASTPGQALSSDDAAPAVSEWRIVAPVMQPEPAAVAVTTNGNGHASAYQCDRCERTFGTANALAAHKRFCPKGGR